MKKERQNYIIKRYQLEHLVPLALTILSIFFWFNFFEYNQRVFIGIFVNIVGLILWWAAKLTIADNWSAGYGKPEIKKLVTYGVYSKICHPLYWGINITLIGLTIIFPNIWYVAISVVIVIYFFNRMRIENVYLLNKLGKEYQEYKKKTWF